MLQLRTELPIASNSECGIGASPQQNLTFAQHCAAQSAQSALDCLMQAGKAGLTEVMRRARLQTLPADDLPDPIAAAAQAKREREGAFSCMQHPQAVKLV